MVIGTCGLSGGELDRAKIATVRGYVEALGGEVEIVAKFGDERITVGVDVAS